MKSTPSLILLFFAFLLSQKGIAQPGNNCSPGNTMHSFDVYHVSFCLADNFKETAKEFDSILFFTSDKKTIRVSVFSIHSSFDDINKYFSSARDNYIKNLNEKGLNLIVDSVRNNEEKFGNIPVGFKKYSLVYKLTDTNTGNPYFMIFDYIKKIKETDQAYKHGIFVFQMVNEDEMKATELNSSLIFSSMNAKNF